MKYNGTKKCNHKNNCGKIKKLDMFGHKPRFIYNPEHTMIQTTVGTIFTLLTVMILGYYSYIELKIVLLNE